MWPFKESPAEPPLKQPGSAPPPRDRTSTRWRLIAILGLLLVFALLGGWAYLAFFRADTAGLEGIYGEWKHEKDKMILTVAFRRGLFQPSMSYKWNREGAGGRGEATFTVLDAKTLELGGGPDPPKITIDSITGEKLVLSGGFAIFGDERGWKSFDKTEFTKQK